MSFMANLLRKHTRPNALACVLPQPGIHKGHDFELESKLMSFVIEKPKEIALVMGNEKKEEKE